MSYFSQFDLSGLLDLHKHQISSHGDLPYIEEIRQEIFKRKERGEKVNGDGMCSEYRNSKRFQEDYIKEIRENGEYKR